MATTATGRIVRLLRDKGFAFVRADDDGQAEYFLHRSAVKGCTFEELTEGTRVKFTPTEGAKGARAENVTVV